MRISPRRWMLSALAPALMVGPAVGQDPIKVQFTANPQPARTFLSKVVFQDVTGPAQVQWQDWGRLVTHGDGDDLGAALAPVDLALRAHLGLTGDFGLVVVEVRDGGRASKAGLKANDILLTLAGQPLTKAEDVLGALKIWSQNHPASPCDLSLLRGGKPATIQVKPEVRVALGWIVEDKPDFFIGTPANPLDATYRSHLAIAEGTGLIAGEIEDGTPASKGGVKSGDILLTFDGQPLPDVDALRAKIQAKGPHPVKLQVLRGGKPTELTVTPERRKAEAQVQGTGNQIDTILSVIDANQSHLQSKSVIRDVPYVGRFFINGANQAGGEFIELQAANPATASPADLAKKIDDLTAQVQALAKAVEALRAGQAEKK